MKLTGSKTSTAAALTLSVHSHATRVPVRTARITDLLMHATRDPPGTPFTSSWLPPGAKSLRTSLDVAAPNVAAPLHRHEPHIHRGHFGVAPALGLREQLFQRMRQQLIRGGILAPAHELRRGDLVEDGRQLMEGAERAQDVVLEQLHHALKASPVSTHQADLVGSSLRDGVRNF